MSAKLVSILDRNIFVLCDDTGDITPSPVAPTGLIAYDTRFLSTWQLTIDGQRLTSLSVDDLQYFENRFFLVPGAATHYVDAKLSVIRHRWVGASFRETLTIINHDERPVNLRVRIEMGSDFADIFEIKDKLGPLPGRVTPTVEDGDLHLKYRRDMFWRETIISCTAAAQVDEHGMSFELNLEPQSSWETGLHVRTRLGGLRGRDIREDLRSHRTRPVQQIRVELQDWLANAPRLNTESTVLARTYRRSLVDLAALRLATLPVPALMPGGGLPWKMALFGRDSLLTCLQAMPFTPEIAVPTLQFLGYLQGAVLDDFREEEPGKIPHEFRRGEAAAFGDYPHAPYYGSADATPLFVILLDEFERWTGHGDFVRELEPEARQALSWINEYADIMGDGYIWYRCRNPERGLRNQGWKDSAESICYGDGRLPEGPLATCELQGYAYDAKLRGARLARYLWNDPGYAQDLEREAAELKERFNRDFWIADGEYYALALDAEGNQIDALASNMGHLLWSGIVDQERAGKVAEHLLGPRLFSGWGVRTLAEGEARFNPVSNYVGAVWPFDNSFIAWGLRRYGFHTEAATIAEGILDAAGYFQGRLPSAFGGYERSLTRKPVGFTIAEGPQALSAGAPLLLLRTLLGLEPYGSHLAIEPYLPVGLGRMELLDIPGRWGRLDAFARGREEQARKERT